MGTGITEWLRTKSLPRHLYELLGRPVLDPDRDGLLRALRAANRELLEYQSHPDRAIAARAMALLTELGRALSTLEDPARLRAHDEEILASLRQEYALTRGPAALEAGDDLPGWLVREHGLDGANAARVAR